MRFQNVKPISEIREEERQSPEVRIAQLEAENTALRAENQTLRADSLMTMEAVAEVYEQLLALNGGTT
ncbi:hypothetical protein LOK74_19035 [Brevibacillus humidisoli]|uniref:hypothetical protein n=1 Tax=Brevibacillus humidisoli TaxID=2895522 RepID=UPI001E4FCC10|nr:hypothetical protein [Brevibacillus humidisoli]UFJ40109.1 hypothetical protein LOK74_19035 [Brevibacillus humidisoli]